ncbi:MAG: hypothetical protein LUE27_11220 [Clostridia bacterium]|nr:hypothetical protein [Clostridia bacterium]
MAIDYLIGRTDDLNTTVIYNCDASPYSKYIDKLRNMTEKQLYITYGFMCGIMNNDV